MLNSNLAVLPELSEITNHLVFKTDINHKQSGIVSKIHHLKRDLRILDQNIRGLKNKTDEMAITIATNPPHVLGFTEHHLKTHQLDNILFQNYKLGPTFCRNIYKNGGDCVCVCVYIYIYIYIFIHESYQFFNINVQNCCKEKDLEVCGNKLYLPNCTAGLLNIYRLPSGNFEYFLNKLETLLNCISINSLELITCGDFNVNFLENTTYKQLLNSLLATYGLYSKIQFPTRITNSSASTIDNIFINTVKFSDFIVHPLINGMSDHDAQIIVLHDIIIQNESKYFCFTRKFNKSLVLDFNIKLMYEPWDSIFSYNDVNLSFNNFLNTYLRIFHSSFPVKKTHYTSHRRAWLTQGIKIYCINKSKLFLNSHNSNDSEIKNTTKIL